MNNTSSRGEMKARFMRMALIRLMVLVVFFAIFIYVFVQWNSGGPHGQHLLSLQQWVTQNNLLGPALSIIGGAIAILIGVPAIFLALLAGMIFGTWAGSITMLSAMAGGCTLIYGLAQGRLQSTLHRLMAKRIQRLKKFLPHQAFAIVVFIRLVFFAFMPSNWLTAALPVPFRTYITATVIGATPHAIIYCWLGASMAQRLLQPEHAQATWVYLLVPAGIAALLMASSGAAGSVLRTTEPADEGNESSLIHGEETRTRHKP